MEEIMPKGLGLCDYATGKTARRSGEIGWWNHFAEPAKRSGNRCPL